MAFANKKDNSNSEERILELFQNRAELKQELLELQKEKTIQAKLMDEKTHRIEQLEYDMKALELHLTQPEHFEDLRAYYQLRRLWNTCHNYIHKFRDRLVDQQRDRERKQQIMEFNQERTKKIAEINIDIDDTSNVLEGIVQRAETITAQIQHCKYPWQYFSKKALIKQQLILQNHQAEAYAELQELYDVRMKIESEPWPEFENVDLPGKRSINLAMIALAQFFYASLTDLDLATKAYEVQTTRPWEISYGENATQTAIITQCDEKLELFSKVKDLGNEVQKRMTHLIDEIIYDDEDDPIPDYDSIPKLGKVKPITNNEFSINFSAAPNEESSGVNILKENYWGLQELMIP